MKKNWETESILREVWPEAVQPDIAQLTEELNKNLLLPTSTDIKGCTSATAAFIVNQLAGKPHKTAAYFDRQLKRSPGQGGNSSALSMWLMRHGYRDTEYVPRHPLDEAAKSYVDGDTTFEDYFGAFTAHFGEVAPEQYEIVRHHIEHVFKPSRLEAEKRFAPYKKLGQMTTAAVEQVDIHTLARELNAGSYIYAEVPMQDSAAGISHAVSFFRPTLEQPAFVFSPGTADQYPGSTIVPFDTHWYMATMRGRLAVGAIDHFTPPN